MKSTASTAGTPAAPSDAERAKDYNPFANPHKDDPYPFYAWARSESPVAYSSVFECWVVTRYDDIIAILADTRRFSSRNSIPSMFSTPPEILEVIRAGCIPEASTIINADPPEHTRMRKILNRAFSAQRINAMQPTIREIAGDLIAAFADAGKADLVAQYSNPLVQTVVSLLLGIPREDIHRVQSWTDDWISLWIPYLPTAEKVKRAHRIVEYERYLLDLMAARRAEPRDDILSDLLHAHGDDLAPLTEGEVLHTFRGVRLAGHDTTRDLISSLLLNLMTHREHLERVRHDSHYLNDTIEETLRRDAPHRGLWRITTEDVSIGGVDLPRGSSLLLLFGSANRDETYFPDPDTFTPERSNISDHLAFGKGTHFCSGAHIARLEARVAVQALVDRLPGIRPAEGFSPSYLPSLGFRGLEHLHVTW
jgi:cytochrome P450